MTSTNLRAPLALLALLFGASLPLQQAHASLRAEVDQARQQQVRRLQREAVRGHNSALAFRDALVKSVAANAGLRVASFERGEMRVVTEVHTLMDSTYNAYLKLQSGLVCEANILKRSVKTRANDDTSQLDPSEYLEKSILEVEIECLSGGRVARSVSRHFLIANEYDKPERILSTWDFRREF